MANFVAGDFFSLKKAAVACAIAFGAVGAATAGPSVSVFDSLNSTPTTFNVAAGGEQVQLGAGPRNFSGYQTYVENVGTADIVTDITLAIFDVTGTTQLFSVLAQNVNLVAGKINLITVDCNCGVLPDQLYYDLSLLSTSADLSFGDATGALAAGTDLNPNDGAVAIRINAVPEPGALGLALAAMGLMAAFRRKA